MWRTASSHRHGYGIVVQQPALDGSLSAPCARPEDCGLVPATRAARLCLVSYAQPRSGRAPPRSIRQKTALLLRITIILFSTRTSGIRQVAAPGTATPSSTAQIGSSTGSRPNVVVDASWVEYTEVIG